MGRGGEGEEETGSQELGLTRVCNVIFTKWAPEIPSLELSLGGCFIFRVGETIAVL